MPPSKLRQQDCLITSFQEGQALDSDKAALGLQAVRFHWSSDMQLEFSSQPHLITIPVRSFKNSHTHLQKVVRSKATRTWQIPTY